MRGRTIVLASGVALLALVTVTAGEGWARAGGGGSRGSRSYSAPVRPAPMTPTPAAPRPSSPSPASPAGAPLPPRPSPWSGLMGGIGGFLLGGLLGSLLFGGMNGGLGGGFGLLDMVLLAAVVFMAIAFFRGRRAPAPEPAYAGAGAGAAGAGASSWGPSAGRAPEATVGSGGAATAEAPPMTPDLEQGLRHIRQMDPSFDPGDLEATAREMFGAVQGAVTLRDVSFVQDRLAPDMAASLQKQCDGLKSQRRTNRTGQIEIRRTSTTEAWQESGQDFVTVYLAASMLDYAVDDGTGAVVEGSSTQPVEVEEYWTFTRPVGQHRWKLSAIQSG